MPADLEWVLRNNWIGEYKWYYSQENGKDIGTPATVDRMFARREQLNDPEYTATLFQRPADMGLIGLEVYNREMLIEAYLLGQELPDDHGNNQLEGELKRFVSQTDGIPIKRVVLNTDSVSAYCIKNNLNSRLGLDILTRLGLPLYNDLHQAA